MERKQKTISTIIVLITAALLGLVWVQIVLLKKAFELAERAHAQNVNAALSNIVSKLEDREIATHAIKTIMKPFAQSQVFAVHARVADDSVLEAEDRRAARDTNFVWRGAPVPPPVNFDRKSGDFTFTLTSPQHVRLRLLDSLGQTTVIVLDERKPAGTYKLKLDSARSRNSGFYYNFNVGSDTTAYEVMLVAADDGEHQAEWFTEERRKKIVAQVLDDFRLPQRIPLESRLQHAVLDSVVRAVLQEQGLDMRYAYAIAKPVREDSLKYATPASLGRELLHSPFRARLFPSDHFYPQHDLVLYFPQQKLYLLRQNGAVLLSIFALLAVIVFCFIYTLRTLFKQKQFGQLLTQFINNMTHEFKTPISTIALASEAFKNPQVLQDREKIQRYSGIILDESQRMRNQVEKILQMAVLEEGDYELNLSKLDVHAALTEVLRNFAVQVEKRKGELLSRFKAAQTVVEADAVHFTNMIHNLLDNANKYTRETPRITVSTASDEAGVHIAIADNGIGLRAEEQRLIFDKYYRVPTGNVHDVKGFGLGLSYVKLMAEAHGGGIRVTSEPNKGSSFELFLPYVCRRGANNGAKA